MGTLVALYKPFDLSLQNVIKYKYLLYISFLFGLVSTVPFYSRKKKRGKRKRRERKTEKGPDVSTSLFAFSLLLSSQLMCVRFFFFLVFFFVFSFLVLFCSFSLFCHFLLVFNLLFVKINKKNTWVFIKKKNNKKNKANAPTTPCHRIVGGKPRNEVRIQSIALY